MVLEELQARLQERQRAIREGRLSKPEILALLAEGRALTGELRRLRSHLSVELYEASRLAEHLGVCQDQPPVHALDFRA